MDEIKGALEEFYAGRLDLNGLADLLDMLLREHPGLASATGDLLAQQLAENRIPVQVFQLLNQRVSGHGGQPDQIQDATRVRTAEDDATRLNTAVDQQPQPQTGQMAQSVQIADSLNTSLTSNPPARPVEGDTLKGRFVLEKEIGSGGMGIVYRALDLRKQEARDKEPYVAVKVLSEELQRDPEAFIALQRETKKAQQLAHPNIATVYDFDRDGETVYMTMELLTGESVEELVKRIKYNGLPFKEAFPIIEGMAKGLAYAHEKDIVHADFKPGNAFILKGGAVKVLDFGIARAVSRPGSTSSDVTLFNPARWEALTPAYASCEMFEQATPDPRDDIYALACVIYELLDGRHPFSKLPANQARSEQMIPEPIAGLNRKQNAALARALAFDRNQRTPSVEQLLSELGATGEVDSKRWLALAGLSLLLVLSAVTLYLLISDTPEQGSGTQVSTRVETLPRNEDSQPDLQPASKTVEAMPDAETLAKIERILEVADLHLAIGRLIEPEGSNATEAYRAVLEMHPSNRRALSGLKKIGAHFESSARKKLEASQLSQALAEVQSGLKADPGSRDLRALEQIINQRMGK